MNNASLKILAVGATGSIGAYVIEEALRQGHIVRALVRKAGKVKPQPGLEIVEAELTQPQRLSAAVEGVDAVLFTHGTYGSVREAERVDYGGVRNILAALGDSPARIALMTAIAVTDRKGAHDWKRRAERLVRLSGRPYTIVRPGWFDYNEGDQQQLLFLQGDQRQSGTPHDGAVGRRQIARVMVSSLTSQAADHKTLELVTEHGPEQEDLDRLFAALDRDAGDALDAVHDAPNMPLDQEPQSVLDDMEKS
ncbi:SDR family oxidoreductase [Sphingobium sp. H39-3-25]|uniref:SDR family oxidoreductase n=1 Tax=Sphingobium arseniciresistens TaxID=3030834 RepID=UPI0023BA1291|nr:SDR family oxidoreductase [Sphingobium arseniciresistens]